MGVHTLKCNFCEKSSPLSFESGFFLPIFTVAGTMGAMDEIFKLYKTSGALHHAYLIEGEVGALKTALLAHFVEHDLPREGHPDFWLGEFETLGIDESRALKEAQAGSAVSGEHRIFVITTTLITHEAQNALLKVFEDPAPGTHFFLLTPSAYALLPTLRSRLAYVAKEREAGTLQDEARAFLGAKTKDRMTEAKRLTEDKDRGLAIRFLEALERELHQAGFEGKENPDLEYARALEAILSVRGYANDRAPALKMLFEYLALMLPRVTDKKERLDS